ncbi:MAG TPA: hydroxymethylbilane synthase [Myxococcota bacterium]|jgi:hydroxymethylbilane synthase
MIALRVATRASELALAQARQVADLLARALGRPAELVPIKTEGDRLASVSLAKLGGKGLFVKEIQDALLDGRADFAVHSAKDLPAVLPAELALVAFPERADPRDALIARERGVTLATLPAGARVGTGSLRRAAQLRARRPDLEIAPLRGNVPTRLRKLESEGLDAVVLACAGLERLGLAERIDERLAPEILLPAVGQGVLAVEARAGSELAREAGVITHRATAECWAAERAVLVGLAADCNVPLAAYAEFTARGALRLRALLAATGGARVLRAELEGPPADAALLGARAAEAILREGGAALLAQLRAEALA